MFTEIEILFSINVLKNHKREWGSHSLRFIGVPHKKMKQQSATLFE